MSIIQTTRVSSNLIAGANTLSLSWPTAFPDNTYFVILPNPETILTSPIGSLQPATITSWVYSNTAGAGITIVVNNPNSSTIASQIDAIGIVAGTQDNFSNFIARLTAIDGIGAAIPSSSSVPTILADLNGIHTSISQLALTVQSQLNQTTSTVNTLQGVIDTLLGGGSGIIMPVNTPAITNQFLTAYNGITGEFSQAALSPSNVSMWVSAPGTSSSTGIVGQIATDGSYLYVCTATNTWVRTAITTF